MKGLPIIESYRRKQAEIEKQIEELKNSKTAKDFPSLQRAFDFLEGDDYAPGYWRESQATVRRPITQLNTEHLKNILEYLKIADDLISAKLDKILDKKLEIRAELNRRGRI